MEDIGENPVVDTAAQSMLIAAGVIGVGALVAWYFWSKGKKSKQLPKKAKEAEKGAKEKEELSIIKGSDTIRYA